MKYGRDKENNMIIGDLMLHNILPPQIKMMSARYKVICECDCCISAKTMRLSLLAW